MKRFYLNILAGAALLAGCTTAPEPPAPQPEKVSQAAPLDLVAAQPAVRAPFKTMDVDGVEMKESRFPDGVSGGKLTLLCDNDPATFNPYVGADAFVWELSNLMFRGLAEMDYYTGEVIPDLASEIKALPDGVSYIVRLRKGLKWSDGKPITAEDVAFTWNTIIAKGYGHSPIREAVRIDGKMPLCTVGDELTVRFVTPKPWVPFKRQLTNPILPKHIVEPVIKSTDGRKAFEDLFSVTCNKFGIVTSGAFTLIDYQPGRRLEFQKNPLYYLVNKAGQRLPYFEGVVYQQIKDAAYSGGRLAAGEADVAELRGKAATDLLKDKERNCKLYDLGPATNTVFLVLNMNQRTDPKTNEPIVDSTKSTWFNDRNFRQGINHALNRSAVCSTFYSGLGVPAFGCLPEISPWYNKALQPFAQDVDLAFKTLDHSGFFKGMDGVLVDVRRNPVEFELAYPSGPVYEAEALQIKEDLHRLGIKVNLKKVEFADLANTLQQGGKWDAALFSLTSDPVEPYNSANVFRSSGRLHLFDQRSADGLGSVAVTDARDWEKRIDEIFDQVCVEFDRSKRAKLLNEFQQIVYDESPFIYIASRKDVVGCRQDVGNWEPTQLSQAVSGAHNLDELYKLPASSAKPAPAREPSPND